LFPGTIVSSGRGPGYVRKRLCPCFVRTVRFGYSSLFLLQTSAEFEREINTFSHLDDLFAQTW
jgi:hypothetical protein